MARPRSPVPALPSDLIDKLDGLDPEDPIEVARRGGSGSGRAYDELETFDAAPTTTMRVRDVSTRVLDSVEADGNGYFAVTVTTTHEDDEGEEVETVKLARFTWYAYKQDPGTPDNDDQAVSLDAKDLLIQRMGDALARFIGFFPTMAESAEKMMAANRDQAQALIEQMNDHMASQQELMIGIAQEERKANRESEAFKLGHRWLDTHMKERGNVRDVQQGLCARLTPDEYDIVKASDAGKLVLGADTVAELRDAASKLVDAVVGGAIKLSPDSMQRIVPWMSKLAGNVAAETPPKAE